MVKEDIFGKLPGGETVKIYTITNSRGEYAQILNYGAALHALFVKDKDGQLGDVVLGARSAANLNDKGIMEGTVMGRLGNRIAGGKFTVDGIEYQLETQETSGNFLHSGSANYAFRFFEGKIIGDDSVCLTQKDEGGAGFKVPVDASITYSFTDDGILRIKYHFVPCGTTLISPTNHAYWNLGYYGDIKNHELLILTDRVAKKTGKYTCAEGEERNVSSTVFDFSTMRNIGEQMKADPDFKLYDDIFIFKDPGCFRKVAEYYAPESGRHMEVFTDSEALIMFAPGFCKDKPAKYEGIEYPPYAAVALETQHVPNAVNCTNYAKPIYRKGEVFDSTTEYRFSCDK